MKIGVFQFPSSDDISKNNELIVSAIEQASEDKVRLLVFHECAACGYPPIETPDINTIDFDLLHLKTKDIANLAQKHDMYIALGTIREECQKRYNSLQIISPDGKIIGNYNKRALWGWDIDNFQKGSDIGIYEIDDVKIGFRICFEVRFPEFFRELYKNNVQLCFVSFSDVSENDLPLRYELIKSHLITRAVENIMTVVSVNSISKYQTAPTAVFNHNGEIVLEAPKNRQFLLEYEFEKPEVTFGMEGRIKNSNDLLNDGYTRV